MVNWEPHKQFIIIVVIAPRRPSIITPTIKTMEAGITDISRANYVQDIFISEAPSTNGGHTVWDWHCSSVFPWHQEACLEIRKLAQLILG